VSLRLSQSNQKFSSNKNYIPEEDFPLPLTFAPPFAIGLLCSWFFVVVDCDDEGALFTFSTL